LGYLSVDGRTLKKLDVKEIGYEVAEWIELAQERIQWRVLVNTVVNTWVPYKTRKFFVSFHDSEERTVLSKGLSY